MSGMVGRMFQEFAVTVTVAIAVSVVVSLTLTPMMGARLLRHEHPENAGMAVTRTGTRLRRAAVRV